jgi:gamma-tubulin complex component 3
MHRFGPKHGPNNEFNEAAIVRDLLYVFQGIEGKFIQFNLLEDAYCLNPGLNVSASTQKIVSELCELGWLFKKVTEWIKNNGEGVQAVSLVAQSLTFAI